jgi:hypothetical protein
MKKNNLKPISKKAKMKMVYGKGGILNYIGDLGKGIADNALSVVGATDVIPTSSYDTKFFGNLSNITNQVAKVGGQVAATALGGPLGGTAMGAIQGGIGNATARPVVPGEAGWGQQIGDAVGQLGGLVTPFVGGGPMAGRSVVNNNLPVAKHGGVVGPTINAERNELIIDPKTNKVMADLKNLPPHPENENKIDPRGTISLSKEFEGKIVIPNKGVYGRKEYMSAMKN